ncbi:MAG TPA: DUF4395 family protein, partial [Acidimicrobiales bacterium]
MGAPMYFDDVKTILGDPGLPVPERLLRLQGWREAELDQAVAAGLAMRLGPAACTALGVAGLVTRSALLYVALAAASAVGVFARNHPVELLWVWWARRRSLAVPPCNRTGRRFACFVAATLFALAGLGAAAGLPVLLYVSGVAMVVVPLFVAVTNLCLPSLVLTVLIGADRVA